MNLDRVKTEWEQIAQEAITCEDIKGTIYAFGSELACLRLAYKFRRCGDKVEAAFSVNLGTWFFRLEPGF